MGYKDKILFTVYLILYMIFIYISRFSIFLRRLYILVYIFVAITTTEQAIDPKLSLRHKSSLALSSGYLCCGLRLGQLIDSALKHSFRPMSTLFFNIIRRKENRLKSSGQQICSQTSIKLLQFCVPRAAALTL